MSHRRPATVADRYVANLLAKHPGLSAIDHEVHTFSEEAARLRDECDRPLLSNAETAWRMANDPDMLVPDDVALYSRWARCRHVYRFDADLASELTDTDVPDSMPAAILERLPYPILFVESRVPFVDWQGGERELLGLFCWLDRGISEHARSYDDWTRTLCARLVFSDGMPGNMSVNVGLKTIGEAIAESVRSDEAQTARLAAYGASEPAVIDHESATRRQYRHLIGHLLYIIADNSDQEVVYRPSGNSRRKNQCQSTIHAVGSRVGRALGSARVRYVGGEEADGSRTVRPHVRAAHWHHYWTGPRDDPDGRKLVVRWVMPTLVNGGRDEEVVTHSARMRR